jgi:hypothetical protein
MGQDPVRAIHEDNRQTVSDGPERRRVMDATNGTARREAMTK